ncbi:MAG: carboxymuconolactone decarboxylase family protein [Candidatus Latescibacteria bacterium]|jgi:uncharacterized peroxidase-related enzyme|nr:carboxymuconolactone decarboxylase family protein [Candidatus Latescibacterota bacterium]MDP7447787.1 carboxymuconolactone decarboxylase family protein [Candidatus Latescibacterota bacterium]HJP33886.1 carboxymuconolactone decarboxylase family protein [Candidatus Latescibacterota bacterium]
MPLVDPLDIDGDDETARLAEFFNETLGYCPNSVLTMLRRPPIARAFIEYNKAVMENKGRVTSSLKRLVGYIASHAAGCRYCEAHTIRAAERYGADAGQLENIWEYRTHAAFSDAERAALDFALAASTVPNAVDAELQSRLHDHWDDGEIIELMGVISLFGLLNRWNDSMATTLEEGAVASGEQWLAARGWNSGKHA